MSEQLKDHNENVTKTAWDDLSEVNFAGETQDSERSQLEAKTREKIEHNPKAKKALSRLIVGAAAAFALLAGVRDTLKTHEAPKQPPVESEQQPTTPLIEAKSCIANLNSFFDGDGEELTWTQNIELGDETTLEVTDENIDNLDPNSIQGFAKKVNISWQESRGDIYTIIDEDGDGYWDLAAQFSPETGESQSVEIGRNEYARYDISVPENEPTETLFDADGHPMPPAVPTNDLLTSSAIEGLFVE